MDALSIIRNNQNELDAGDFTCLLPSIKCNDPKGQLALTEVLKMLGSVGVEPFNSYGPSGLGVAVQRGEEVLQPSYADKGLLVTAKDYKARWREYQLLLEVLGIAFMHGELKHHLLPPHNDEYYLLYWAKDGFKKEFTLYWQNVLGGQWEEIK